MAKIRWLSGKALQECMQHNFSVFREGDAMVKGLEQFESDPHARKRPSDDTSSELHTQRVAFKLDNPMETAAYATAVSANFRTESRVAARIAASISRSVMMPTGKLCHTLYQPQNGIHDVRRSVNINRNCVRRSRAPKIRTLHCGDSRMMKSSP